MTYLLSSILTGLIAILAAALLLQIVTRIVTLLIGTVVKIFGGKFNAKAFNSGLFRGIVWLLTTAVFVTILLAAVACFGPVALGVAGGILCVLILGWILSRWFHWVWKQE